MNVRRGFLLFAMIGTGSWVGCGGAASSTITDTGGDGGAASSANGGVTTNGGVNPADAGPGGTTSAVSCGNTSCAIPANVCCVTRTSAGTSYTCETGPVCAQPGAGADAAAGNNNNGDTPTASLGCTDQANCPAGSVCCATRTDATGTVSSCTTGTTCGKNATQLCDPNAPTASNGCTIDQQCTSENVHDLGLPATFGTCAQKH